jgi:copper chaperone NosL
MKPARTAMALLFAVVMLAGCDQSSTPEKLPAPQEVSDLSVAHFCSMLVKEHPGPKGQIFLSDSENPVWFASVIQTFAFTMLPEEPKNIVAIYVTDMGRAKNWDQPEPGSWIDAKKAFYVIESRQRGGMGSSEAIPFGDEAEAKRFIEANGGRIVTFTEMPESYVLQSSGSSGDGAADEGMQ